MSMRDALYEAPGPRLKRIIRIGTVIALVLVAVVIAAIVHRFWLKGQLAPRYWSFFAQPSTWAFLGSGLLGTFAVALSAGLIAIVLGLVLMLGRTSTFSPLALVCRVVTEFFRGVPSLLLIYFFFMVLPQLGVKLDAFWMICPPIALTASGVLAEVFRSGVNAVPKGQVEAALSLGMRPLRVKFVIVLPQAIRYVIPSLISQLVVVVKDTTLAYVVSYPDFLQNARVLISRYDAQVSTYLVVAVVYVIINYLINQVAVTVSRKTGARVAE